MIISDEDPPLDPLLVDKSKWIQLYLTSPPQDRPPLLDIRLDHEYASLHIDSSTHFSGMHGPDGLLSRLNELPPPQSRLNLALVAATTSDATLAAAALAEKGYGPVLPLTFSALLSHLPVVSGVQSRPLWQPAPVLSDVLPRILSLLPVPTALDVGCGSGRDVAYLAAHGVTVTAVDRDAALVGKAVRLAARPVLFSSPASPSVPAPAPVTGLVRTLGANLGEDASFFRTHAAGLLLVVRFLRRGVLDLLPHAVLPGGFVIYEHFLRGCELFGGPVKKAQMLQPGELRSVFTEARGFTVCMDGDCRLADGRPVVRFVARRNP